MGSYRSRLGEARTPGTRTPEASGIIGAGRSCGDPTRSDETAGRDGSGLNSRCFVLGKRHTCLCVLGSLSGDHVCGGGFCVIELEFERVMKERSVWYPGCKSPVPYVR